MAIDVLVAGGGSAGLAAAVSAARCGARTLLVERHGMLGGMGVAALVHSFCGLYELPDENGPRWANPGFASELAVRLIALGGAVAPVRMGRVFVLPHQPAAFARLADEIAAETANLEVLLHSEVIAVRGDFSEVEISTRGARRIVKPRAILDATGDGAIAAAGGAAFEQTPSEHLQRPAFIFGLHGVNPSALEDEGRLKIAVLIARAVAGGALPSGALGAAVRSTGRGGETYVTIDLGISQAAYWNQVIDYSSNTDLWHGIGKSAIFSVLITLIGVANGASVEGGAEGVGRVTTRAVVQSISAIVITDMLFVFAVTAS